VEQVYQWRTMKPERTRLVIYFSSKVKNALVRKF